MKQSNDQAIIRLVHMPSGEEVDWQISSHAVPSVHYIQNRVEKHRLELQGILDEEDDDDLENVDKDRLARITELNGTIFKLKMDALSCILEPKGDVPDQYASKREYLEECIGSYEVVYKIMDFFSEHFVSTIKSAGRSRPLLQILDQNGEPWDSNNTSDSAEKTSSTGSA